MKDKNNYVTWTQVGNIALGLLILLAIIWFFILTYKAGYTDGKLKETSECIEFYHVHHSYITGYGI